MHFLFIRQLFFSLILLLAICSDIFPFPVLQETEQQHPSVLAQTGAKEKSLPLSAEKVSDVQKEEFQSAQITERAEHRESGEIESAQPVEVLREVINQIKDVQTFHEQLELDRDGQHVVAVPEDAETAEMTISSTQNSITQSESEIVATTAAPPPALIEVVTTPLVLEESATSAVAIGGQKLQSTQMTTLLLGLADKQPLKENGITAAEKSPVSLQESSLESRQPQEKESTLKESPIVDENHTPASEDVQAEKAEQEEEKGLKRVDLLLSTKTQPQQQKPSSAAESPQQNTTTKSHDSSAPKLPSAAQTENGPSAVAEKAAEEKAEANHDPKENVVIQFPKEVPVDRLLGGEQIEHEHEEDEAADEGGEDEEEDEEVSLWYKIMLGLRCARLDCRDTLIGREDEAQPRLIKGWKITRRARRSTAAPAGEEAIGREQQQRPAAATGGGRRSIVCPCSDGRDIVLLL